MLEGEYEVEVPDGAGGTRSQSVALRRATNALLTEDYAKECQKTVTRWNQTLARADLSYRLALPSPPQRDDRPVARTHP